MSSWRSPKTIRCRIATSPCTERVLSMNARGVALRLTSASDEVGRHRMSRHSTSKLFADPLRTLTVTPSTGVISTTPAAAIFEEARSSLDPPVALRVQPRHTSLVGDEYWARSSCCPASQLHPPLSAPSSLCSSPCS